MKFPRILPYILGLIVLAFALASLSHGTPGGSLLFRSYWLLYLIYLGPVVILGAMVAVVVIIGLNYRDIGAAIGYGMARRRQARKRGSRYAVIVQMFFWALAIGVLIETKGSIFNPTQEQTLPSRKASQEKMRRLPTYSRQAEFFQRFPILCRTHGSA